MNDFKKKMNEKIKLYSNDKYLEKFFKNEFEKYITYKQSLGYYRNLESKKIYELVSLNNFLNSFNLSEIKITKEMVDIYLETNSSLSQGTQHSKECVLRQFCKFLKSQGYENIYISYEAQVKMPRDFIPYVFSDDEITRIFKAVDNMKFKNNEQSKCFYQTVFRLLYCTGLRVGEVSNLKVDDVDFKESDTYFFESPRGGKRSPGTICAVFRNKILPMAGIKSSPLNGYKRGACVHSLRHSFACNALNQMIKSGKDPYCALPYLSVYLGHTSIVNTEIYLRLTLQRHEEIINAGHYIYLEGIGEI